MPALPNVDIVRNPMDKQLAHILELFLEKLKINDLFVLDIEIFNYIYIHWKGDSYKNCTNVC
jgi:hypothetical protein